MGARSAHHSVGLRQAGTSGRIGLIAAGLLALLTMPDLVAAQNLSFQTGSGGGSEPEALEVTAEGALEWQRDANAYVARGNAAAVRGDLKVEADILIAYYRETATGGTEIYRLDARGNVRMYSADAVTTGETAVYDVGQSVAVVSGGNLELTTATEVIRARDSLEYWQDRRLAVARGNARALRAENELRSEILTATFEPDDAGELAMRTIDATGGVVIETPDEIVQGAQGRFDVLTNIATLFGDVKLTRGGTQLNGDRAQVNMETGVSRLLSDTGSTGNNRVRGVVRTEDLNGAGG